MKDVAVLREFLSQNQGSMLAYDFGLLWKDDLRPRRLKMLAVIQH